MYVAEKTRNYTIFALKFFVFVFENNINIQITDLIPKQFLKILFFKTKKIFSSKNFPPHFIVNIKRTSLPNYWYAFATLNVLAFSLQLRE